jgi:hypothetical protein
MLMQNILKYLLEGLAIALAIYLVNKNIKPKEILMISLVGAVTFAVLDLFAPNVGSGARLGAGFGLGAKHVGFGEHFQQGEEEVMMPEETDEVVQVQDEEQEYVEMPEVPEMQELNEEINETEDDLLGFDESDDTLASFEEPTNEEIQKEMAIKNKNVNNNRDNMEGFTNYAGLLKQARNVGQVLTQQARNVFTEGFQSEVDLDTPSENNKRIGGVLYSGDIVNLYEASTFNTDNKSIVQRSATSSDILVTDEIQGVKTNLSKLRLVKEDVNGGLVSSNRQVPISYGDTVFIRHNAYVNSVNTSLFVKVGKRVHSHQSGPGFNRFVILNPSDNSLTDNIKYGDSFVLKYEGSGADLPEGYLYKVTGNDDIPNSVKIQDHDGDIGTSVTEKPDPLVLVASLVRVHELGNRQLAVEPKGVLFP